MVGTLVCVKAATREALDDKGTIPIAKVRTCYNGTSYDILWNITGSCHRDEYNAYGAYHSTEDVPNTILTIAVNKGTSNKEGRINQVDAGGDNHRDDACCFAT